MRDLLLVENLPGRREQPETRSHEDEAQKVEWPEMGVRPPSEHDFEQMPGVVGEKIDSRKPAREPTRKQVDRQRIAVHFGEERHQEGRERAERPPVARALWLGETEREDDEDERIDDHQRPEAVSLHLIGFVHEVWSLFVFLRSPPCPPCPPCPWNRCNRGHANSSRYGRALNTCAWCSVMRK